MYVDITLLRINLSLSLLAISNLILPNLFLNVYIIAQHKTQLATYLIISLQSNIYVKTITIVD